MSLLQYAASIDDFRAKLKALENCRFPIWETEKISDFVAFAIDRLCPARLGELVELVDAPMIAPDSGWWHSRHVLVAGRMGYVREIDWRDGEFVFGWEPLDQTWISDQDGIERPVDRPSMYFMRASRFAAGRALGEKT